MGNMMKWCRDFLKVENKNKREEIKAGCAPLGNCMPGLCGSL